MIHKPSPEGGIFATLWEFVAVRDLDGAVDAIQCVGFDISDRVAVEQALRESEARFRAVFENAAIGIAILDARGAVQTSNPTLAAMLGYSESELRRKSVVEVTHPDDLPADFQLFQELVHGRRNSYQLEKRYYRKDGALVWARLSVTGVRNEAGEIQNIISVVEDITERHLAVESLRRNEGRLRAILENALDLVSFVSADLKTEYVSPAFTRVFGYELDEFLHQSIADWIHPEDLPAVIAQVEKLLTEPGDLQG
ncbi:MAG: PAS domain S-box protein [Anaerolineales bacterium]|nr:PAS domain S-box protein [Anaerolineales bacterium]